MHLVFLNPQGNFDPRDSHLTEHPDFGGQLVYVKELAQAMAAKGHRVDILTRRIVDADWPEFAGAEDRYPGFEDRLRILRLDCGGPAFLAKEQLWAHLPEWVENILRFYDGDGGALPDFATAHYADGGYAAALLQERAGLAFTFTGHSLGAQKLDKLGTTPGNLDDMERRFRFSRRIAAERVAMGRAARIITSTRQERMEQYAHPLYEGAIDVHDDGRFAVIPPGVNTRIFTTEPGEQDERVAAMLAARLGTASGPCIVVSSRLDEKKNILGVVKAYAASTPLQERADLVLCFRGMDDPFSAIATLPEAERAVLAPILETIEGAKLTDRVHFVDLDSQEALASAYRLLARRGSVFALTAFYEPFGLAPIEAAACGLACVATRNGGPSEIFGDGSGVLVDPFDEADIARGLIEALERQDALSRQGRARVLSTYTWSRTAEGYLEVTEQARSEGPVRGQPVPKLDASDIIAAYVRAA